jgi:hypothetical protein
MCAEVALALRAERRNARPRSIRTKPHIEQKQKEKSGRVH